MEYELAGTKNLSLKPPFPEKKAGFFVLEVGELDRWQKARSDRELTFILYRSI
jgi:hypothetical protein